MEPDLLLTRTLQTTEFTERNLLIKRPFAFKAFSVFSDKIHTALIKPSYIIEYIEITARTSLFFL